MGAGTGLKQIAGAANIPLPNALGPEDQAMRDHLGKMQGDAFVEIIFEAKSTPIKIRRNSSNMTSARGKMCK